MLFLGSNRQNQPFAGSHHRLKKFSPAKISIPAGRINPHLTAIWKTLVMNILKIYKYINILETKIFIIIYYTYIIITPTVEFRSESYYNYVL